MGAEIRATNLDFGTADIRTKSAGARLANRLRKRVQAALS